MATRLWYCLAVFLWRQNLSFCSKLFLFLNWVECSSDMMKFWCLSNTKSGDILFLWPVTAVMFGSVVALAYIRLHQFHRLAHCPLSTTHCPHFTAHFPLPTVHCPLSTVHCQMSTVHYPLSTSHCPLSTTHNPLFTTHCPHFTAHCPLPTVHIPLSTVHIPLSTSQCLLSTFHCPLSTGQMSMFKTWPINITFRSKLLPKNTSVHLGRPWRKRDRW